MNAKDVMKMLVALRERLKDELGITKGTQVFSEGEIYIPSGMGIVRFCPADADMGGSYFEASLDDNGQPLVKIT